MLYAEESVIVIRFHFLRKQFTRIRACHVNGALKIAVKKQ